MPKPTSAAKQLVNANGITMRVVLITMDTHLASAAQRSSAALQQQLPGAWAALRADPAPAAQAQAGPVVTGRLPEWATEWLDGTCACGVRLVRIDCVYCSGHIACSHSGMDLGWKCPNSVVEVERAKR